MPTYRASLPAKLRPQFDTLIELLGKTPKTLADYYCAGTLIRKIEDEKRGYGSAWMDHLHVGLNDSGCEVSRSFLFRLRKLTLQFTAGQIRKLDGKVNWESLMRLLAVEKGPREAILATILEVEKPPSSRVVQQMIRKQGLYRNPRGGAEREGPSSHPNEALRALRALAQKWPAIAKAWTKGDGKERSALVRVSQMTTEQIIPAFLTHLEETAMAIGKMAKEGQDLADKLTALTRLLRSRVEPKKADSSLPVNVAARRNR